MKIKSLVLFLAAALVSGAFADPSVSIFVKDAQEFETIQKDLESLKSEMGGNPDLDSLWNLAGRIAQMNADAP